MGKDGDPGQARRGPHSNPENWYGGGGTRGKEGGDGDTPGRRARERQGQKRETGGQGDSETERSRGKDLGKTGRQIMRHTGTE